MINRDRAWRRRTERRTTAQAQVTQEVVTKGLDTEKPGTIKELKQHRHGALTHVQQAKLSDALGEDLRDIA